MIRRSTQLPALVIACAGALSPWCASQTEIPGKRELSSRLRELMRTGKRTQAIEYLLRVRESLKKAPPNSGTSDLLNEAGMLLRRVGEAGAALEAHKVALRILRDQVGDMPHAGFIAIPNNIGLALGDLERQREALAYFRAALKMAERMFRRNHDRTANSLAFLGHCLSDVGRHEEGETHLRRALAMRRELAGQRQRPKDSVSIANVLNNLALCITRAGRANEAVALHREAIDLCSRHGRPDELGACYNAFSVCLRRLGRSAEAAAANEKALELFQQYFKRPHFRIPNTMNKIGMAFMDQGLAAQAQPHFEAALAMLRGLSKSLSYVAVKHNLALCLAAQRKFDAALRILQDVLRATRSRSDGQVSNLAIGLENITRCHLGLGDPAAAARSAEEALRIGRRENLPINHRLATTLATVRLAQGRPRAARDLLREAIEDIEAQRQEGSGLQEQDRADYFAELRRGSPYVKMARALLTLEETESALQYLEQGQSRSLLDLLARSHTDPLEELLRDARTSGDKTLEQRIRKLIAGIEEAEDDVLGLSENESSQDNEKALGAARTKLRERLRERGELVRKHVRFAHPATVAELQDVIAKNERLLYFSVSEGHGTVFVVPPRGTELRAFPLAVEPARLEPMVDEYLSAIGIQDQPARGRRVTTKGGAGAKTAKLGHALFRAIIPEAVWEEVRRSDRVYVVPSGPLFRLPFESLVTHQTGKKSRYWLDDGPPIAYAPSGSVLRLSRQRRADQLEVETAYDILAVGAPEYSRDTVDLPQLPGTRHEVESIFETFTGVPYGEEAAKKHRYAVVLTGTAATEGNVFAEAGKARIVHLATHALVKDGAFATYSSLALTPPARPARGDDGFLTLHDLLERWRGRMPGCQLVVLSSCESQKGRMIRSEGFFALPWGMMYAGSSSVIASLWLVSDDSTARLMSDFYRRLRIPKGGDCLDAFTTARKSLKRTHPEPRYWAPFVYLGHPGEG